MQPLHRTIRLEGTCLTPNNKHCNNLFNFIFALCGVLICMLWVGVVMCCVLDVCVYVVGVVLYGVFSAGLSWFDTCQVQLRLVCLFFPVSFLCVVFCNLRSVFEDLSVILHAP